MASTLDNRGHIGVNDRPQARWALRSVYHRACPKPDGTSVRALRGLGKWAPPRSSCHTRYDAVGNLLSITRNTGGVGAPTITAFTPNTGNVGVTVNVSLTGTNLTGASLATTNPGLLVRNVVTMPTSIAATFQTTVDEPSSCHVVVFALTFMRRVWPT